MSLPLILAGAGDPLSHVLDKPKYVFFGDPSKDLVYASISMNSVTLVAATILLIAVMMQVAKAIAPGAESMGNERYITKGRFAQMIEVIVLYIRDKVVQPQLGDATPRYLPFLLTIFFFILFNNMLGLVPLIDVQYIITALANGQDHTTAWIGGTATGRLGVTAALATVAFLFWQYNGITQGGLKNWAKHFLGGAPWYLAPVMVPVEIIGMFVKPIALTLRLFANMTAGHILLGILIVFTAMAPAGMGVLFGAPVTIVSFIAAVAVFFLEIFVALLQAFIFTFLSTLFVAQLVHHHDEHHEGHDHDHAHGHGHDHGGGPALAGAPAAH
jgi:F-type H+-transporting ATPase subunit a